MPSRPSREATASRRFSAASPWQRSRTLELPEPALHAVEVSGLLPAKKGRVELLGQDVT